MWAIIIIPEVNAILFSHLFQLRQKAEQKCESVHNDVNFKCVCVCLICCCVILMFFKAVKLLHCRFLFERHPGKYVCEMEKERMMMICKKLLCHEGAMRQEGKGILEDLMFSCFLLYFFKRSGLKTDLIINMTCSISESMYSTHRR